MQRGLVEETTFVQVSCSCDGHRRYSLSFVEDAMPRAGFNGARTFTRQVMCPNSPLHAVHQEVDLHPILSSVFSADQTDTVEERDIDGRVAAAELHLFRGSSIPTGTEDL